MFDETAKPILARLRSLAARHPNVEVVDVTDAFCDFKRCPPVRNGVPMYWDARHINVSAARAVRFDEVDVASR